MIPEHRTAHCGSILHFRADPGLSDDPEAYDFWERGALIVADGLVEAVGPAAALLPGAAAPRAVLAASWPLVSSPIPAATWPTVGGAAASRRLE